MDRSSLALFRSLHHRPFALLWSGQTISVLGDNLYRVALAWWVLEKTGSAAVMGGVLVFSFVPTVLFSLIGGVAVDRFRRPPVMLASDLLRAFVVVAVALLASSGRLAVWHMDAASFIFGSIGAFFLPAYTAIVPEIAPGETLPSANSLTGISQQFAGIIGPGLGAAIVARWGTAAAFSLDGVSFLWSACCLVPLLALTSRPDRDRQRKNVLEDIHEGVGFVLGIPWLWVTIAFASLVNISYSGPWSVALPFLVKEHMHAGVGSLGLLYATLSLGFGLGAAWLGRLSRIRRRGVIAYGGWAIGGLMTLLLGLPLPLVATLTVVLIAGIANAAFALIWTNTLQEMVPHELLGRVASVDSLGSVMLLPAGYALAGWATDQIGPSAVFLIGGAVTFGLCVLVLAHPAIRHLD
jgi:MFS family permease